MLDTSSVTVVEAMNLTTLSEGGQADVPDLDHPRLLPLDEVGPRQQFRRTGVILQELRVEAEENGVSPTQLLGFLLHKDNYVSDRKFADVGMRLFRESSVANELSENKGLHFLSSYNLGRTAYTNLRRDLKEHVILPAHYKLMEKKRCIVPKLSPQRVGDYEGVTASLKQSCTNHKARLIVVHPDIPQGYYKVICKDGLDGSGRHAVYHQTGQTQTYNMILYMWTPLEIIKEDGTSAGTSVHASGRI